MNGLEAFRRSTELDAKVPVILMTGHGSATTAIDAMRLGDRVPGQASRPRPANRIGDTSVRGESAHACPRTSS